MAQDHDFNTGTGASGVAFALGLLAGAAIGVGVGLLFAPQEGATLRRDIAKRARDLRDDAGEQIDRVTEAADDLVERGRDVAQRARSAVSSGIREARRYGAGVAADVADAVKRTESWATRQSQGRCSGTASGMVSTGQTARRTTCCAVDPTNIRSTTPRPCAPMTMRPARRS